MYNVSQQWLGGMPEIHGKPVQRAETFWKKYNTE
jgi:hypothetical protein